MTNDQIFDAVIKFLASPAPAWLVILAIVMLWGCTKKLDEVFDILADITDRIRKL